MGDVDTETIDVKGMSDKELKSFMTKNAISLKISEAKKWAAQPSGPLPFDRPWNSITDNRVRV